MKKKPRPTKGPFKAPAPAPKSRAQPAPTLVDIKSLASQIKGALTLLRKERERLQSFTSELLEGLRDAIDKIPVANAKPDATVSSADATLHPASSEEPVADGHAHADGQEHPW